MRIAPTFTLKVKKCPITGHFISDDRHYSGGTDLKQTYAFKHLFPSGACNWMFEELLFDMAELHNWDVEITDEKKD